MMAVVVVWEGSKHNITVKNALGGSHKGGPEHCLAPIWAQRKIQRSE